MANGQRPGPDDTIFDDSTIRDDGDIKRQGRGWEPVPQTRPAKQPVALFVAIALVAVGAVAAGLYVLNSKNDGLVFERGSTRGDTSPHEVGLSRTQESGQEVLKEIDRSRLKQVSLAIQMYAADYDDVLPRPLENLELVYPYLKDRDLLKSSLDGLYFKVNRKYSGYPLTAIEDIASTPLIYSPAFNDGTRVVGYTDAHVKVTKDNPVFASLHLAEPLIRLPKPPPPGGDPPDKGDAKLVATEIEGRTIQVPVGWKPSQTSNGAMRTYKWDGPRDGTYIRLDISRDRGEDLYAQMLDFESRFQNSSRYRYERRNLRVGNEAYNGGVLWNFRISKDGGPTSRRTIAYWKSNGNSYGLVTNSWEGSRSYADLYTKVLNSITGW